MRKEFIIFKNTEPSTKEICSSIEHFCMDHCMEYKFLRRNGSVKIKIDGDIYQTELKEEHMETPAYWMIRCKMSSKS